ncbi:hypothetical protein C8Q75DRAFT_811489 [Abortiporus biennis]|nr:hypothetical protein C8Q75DRAFT_811489 [Abortiporus biennis]
MSRHFCCCIPVRVAVFVLSLASLIFGGLCSVAIWIIVHDIETGKTIGDVDLSKIDNKGKIVFIVAGVITTIITLISLFGFIGAVIRNRKFVKIYSFMTWLVFLFYCAAAGFFFYGIFSGKNLFPGCEVTNIETNVTTDCTIKLPLWQKIVSVACVIVSLFLSLYIAIVIGRYGHQLEDEEWKHDYKLAKNANNNTTYTPTYYPPTAQEQGLLAPTGHYPYSDAAHSFGNTHH